MDDGEELSPGRTVIRVDSDSKQLLEDLLKAEFEKAHCEDSKKQFNLCQAVPAPRVQLTNEVKVT